MAPHTSPQGGSSLAGGGLPPWDWSEAQGARFIGYFYLPRQGAAWRATIGMAAPRALASVLAVVLEDMSLYTLDDFADFLDGGFAAVQLLVSRIRSDDIVAALRTSVASDVMGVARVAAEHRLLDCELRAMEESANSLQLALRGATAAADMLILEEELSTATAELRSARQAAARRNEALKSMSAQLAAVKAELSDASQARDAAEKEVRAARELGARELDARAARGMNGIVGPGDALSLVVWHDDVGACLMFLMIPKCPLVCHVSGPLCGSSGLKDEGIYTILG